jgi:hypothetical protein
MRLFITLSKYKTADGYFVTKTSAILLTDMHPSQQQMICESNARGGGCQTNVFYVIVLFQINDNVNIKEIYQTYTFSGKRERIEESLKRSMRMLGILIKMLNKEDIMLD